MENNTNNASNNLTLETNGGMSFASSTNTTSGGLNIYGEKILVKSYLDAEKNQFVLVYRQKSNITYCTSTSTFPSVSPDAIWKEIYGVEEGKIKLIKTIKGVHTPARFLPESFEFEE